MRGRPERLILTDGVHIISDTSVRELHRFADKAGIKRCWYHPNRRHPHFDKPKRYPVQRLIEHGAVMVRTRALVERCCAAEPGGWRV